MKVALSREELWGRRREELKIDEVTMVVWLWVRDLKFGGKNDEAGFGNLGI